MLVFFYVFFGFCLVTGVTGSQGMMVERQLPRGTALSQTRPLHSTPPVESHRTKASIDSQPVDAAGGVRPSSQLYWKKHEETVLI